MIWSHQTNAFEGGGGDHYLLLGTQAGLRAPATTQNQGYIVTIRYLSIEVVLLSMGTVLRNGTGHSLTSARFDDGLGFQSVSLP